MALRTATTTLHAVDAGSTKLDRLVTRVAEIAAKLKALTTEKETLNARLLDELRRVGEADAEGTLRADTDTHRLTLVKGSNSRIDKAKLLALNVAPRIVKKATVTTEYEYVKLTAKKED